MLGAIRMAPSTTLWVSPFAGKPTLEVAEPDSIRALVQGWAVPMAAEVPEGVFLEGYGPADAGPGCGDSLAVECAGLGATVIATAPALWALVGTHEGLARKIFEETAEIALGEHPHYRVPVLGDRGAPTGIDLLRVVETGIRPVIDIVMVHREPGRGK